ncbi:hypothetical protein QA612_01545 [Evansella sp. AB-P1]|uniref:hypothetical protein n=1 Tax=Evansella sp. AB-P1 TaxID=3037653 RepID=UPI00241E76AA|nr:hypothetical protein [Evansella sp. AB-P1]MDG5786157.1 hypothetical protein [Evansella sp. AB-P1]
MKNNNIDIQDLFSNMEGKLFDLNYTFYKGNKSLSMKLEAFVVSEAKETMDHIRMPWTNFNEGIIQRFEKLNQPHLTLEVRQEYMKEALEFVAPKNIVQLFDDIFNTERLSEIKGRYEATFTSFKDNEFAFLIDRYKVPEDLFKLFSNAFVENSSELTEPLKRLSRNYVKLLETLKEVQHRRDTDLFSFGAGVLGSMLAGPIGGMATRSIIKVSNSKEERINKDIRRIYSSLENIHNLLEASLLNMHKKILYINYTMYGGLINRIEEDVLHIGYELKDIDFTNRKLHFTIGEQEVKKIISWYRAIQSEIVGHIKNHSFKEADIISQNVLQFFIKNTYARKIVIDDVELGYCAAILRYTVLTQWLEHLSMIDSSKENETSLMHCYSYYTKLFNDFNIGVNNIHELDGIKVPTMLETVVNYIHLTERLVKITPEKGFQLRTNTLNNLMEYITNFSEKKLGEHSFSFENEFIDRYSLELVSGYQIFLKSINMTTVTNVVLKKCTPNMSLKELLHYYSKCSNNTLDLSESYFYQFLLSNQNGNGTYQAVKQKGNSDLLLDKSKQATSKKQEEENERIPLLQLFSFLEMNERIHNGSLEDNEEGREQWRAIWNEKIDFLERLQDAKQGNPESQYMVGAMYTSGKGVDVNDQEAFYWFFEAAKQNHHGALEIIPHLFYRGKGVAENPTKAFYWMWRLGEELGKAKDQLIIGSMFLEGYGTDVDYNKAFDWFMRAAKQGDPDAQHEIGKMYDQGQGGLIDIQEAKRWYEKAAAQGQEEAKKRLEEIRKEERKAKFKKGLKIVAPIAAAVLIALFVNYNIIVPNAKYNEANQLMEDGNFEDSIFILRSLGDYKDSKEIISNKQEEMYARGVQHLENEEYNLARRAFISASDYSNAKVILSQLDRGFDAGVYHSVGLNKDGTVMAFGENRFGRLDVEEWKNIIAVEAGRFHTLGLKQDGTVEIAGGVTNLNDKVEMIDLSSWKNIVSIASRNNHIVGLQKDGSVVGTGLNNYGQINVNNWEDIDSVSTGGWHTVGLKNDGTVVATGANHFGQINVKGWNDIVMIATGNNHTVGLKGDGTVVATGHHEYDQTNVRKWEDIIAIAAGGFHTYGLKSDGTVIAVGDTYFEILEVDEWENIIAISAGDNHVIALMEDGTIVANGYNKYGQLNAVWWEDISVPIPDRLVEK